MDNFVVITSINEPSEAVIEYSKWKKWKLIVVGDKKTPNNWKYENVLFLDFASQITDYAEFSEYVPENTYVRKMFGYLHAIKLGAKHIFETDDDNIPYENANLELEHRITTPSISPIIKSETGWANIYRFFSIKNVWPRGYPLNKITEDGRASITQRNKECGILQFLADGDPDVDAIYRLTSNESIEFDKNKAYALDTFCNSPTNSQATLWNWKTFPLLFLPIGISDRVTDILRGYIALHCLWKRNSTIGLVSPIVFQKRNYHNLLHDFSSELQLYLDVEKWISILQRIEGNTYKELYASALTNLVNEKCLPNENSEAYKVFTNTIEKLI